MASVTSGGNGRVGCRGVEDRCGSDALEAGSDLAGSFNADDCDTRDCCGIDGGLPARDDRNASAEDEGAVEGCDCGGARVEAAEVFAAFPYPEGARGQRTHAAG